MSSNPVNISELFNIYLPWSDSSIYWDFGNVTTIGRTSAAWGGAINTYYVWSFDNDSSPAEMHMWRNGLQFSTNKSSSGTLTSGGSYTLEVGSLIAYGNYHNGTIAEIIIYNTALSDTARMSTEFTLAKKWGIELQYNPGSPVLWLDASDSTALFTGNDCTTGGSPANGAAIRCLKDKSGNNRHATHTLGNPACWPTYVTNAQNGKSVLTFDGVCDYLTAPASVLATVAQDITIFITSRATALQNQNSIMASYSDMLNINLPHVNGTTQLMFGIYPGGWLESYGWAGGYDTWKFQNVSSSTVMAIWRNGTMKA